MLEYKILVSTRSQHLVTQVKKYIEKGWVPLGGLAITEDETIRHWAQAMTKETL